MPTEEHVSIHMRVGAGSPTSPVMTMMRWLGRSAAALISADL